MAFTTVGIVLGIVGAFGVAILCVWGVPLWYIWRIIKDPRAVSGPPAVGVLTTELMDDRERNLV